MSKWKNRGISLSNEKKALALFWAAIRINYSTPPYELLNNKRKFVALVFKFAVTNALRFFRSETLRLMHFVVRI